MNAAALLAWVSGDTDPAYPKSLCGKMKSGVLSGIPSQHDIFTMSCALG